MSPRNAAVIFATAMLAAAGALVAYFGFIDAGERESTRTREDITATRQGDEPAMLLKTDFMAASGGIKTAVAEYYISMGKWPASNADAGLPAPDEYRGKSLRSASVAGDGSVTFTFDAASGVDGGRLRLIPDIAHANAMGVQWRCETGDYAWIKRALPACEYAAVGALPLAIAPDSGR
jgi:type IV pilus assembly protein PilA